MSEVPPNYLMYKIMIFLLTWCTHYTKVLINWLINLRRACAARIAVGSSLRACVCVCLSVTTFSATTRNEAAKYGYVPASLLQQRLDLKKAIFVKLWRSKVMA